MTGAAPEASALADTWLHGLGNAEQVRRLCALATSDDPAVAQSGTDAIFRRIVELLGDSFDPRDCDRYIEFFAEVIDFCRQLPPGRALDDKLRAFGLQTHNEFAARAGRVRNLTRFQAGPTSSVKKILVVSRVTLGADVAVTSVVLSRLKEVFPEAQICLLGSAKAGSLFASDPRVRLIAVDYSRAGTLLERLNAWPVLAAQVAAATRGLRTEEYLVVDPDSRLTQLGLLPLAPDESRYLFFQSRSYDPASNKRLGELTNQWLDEVFGPTGKPSLPYLGLADADVALGSRVRESAKGRLAVVNLGVGENLEKRVGGPFELDLLLLLLRAGYRVLLDRGAGEEELLRTADDLYIGYDSAGGHIAAAAGVPGIDVFAGEVSARMRQRWIPWGRKPSRVIAVAPGTAPANILRRIQEQLE
jgi:hypothetical protein